MNNLQVKTMLALFVPEGFSNQWISEQLAMGGFDMGRDYMTIGHTDEDGVPIGEWLMQEVISKIH